MTANDRRRSLAPAAAMGGSSGNLFQREGEYWTIVYEGTLLRLKDRKGLRYLAHLLSHPDARIDCEDLCADTRGPKNATPASAERARVAVTKRIKSAIATIAPLHPRLGHHLSTRVKTGYACVYLCDPRGPISWNL